MSHEPSPLVSILIISYNHEDFIEEALDSALAQDYDNLEIIVSDDNSQDETPNIIKRYAEQYPGKVVPIVDVENLGITGNSNRGYEKCRGKYIAFQGGDDVLLPGKIKAQVEWFEQDSKRALCYHDMDVFLSETNETLYYQSEILDFYEGGAEVVVKYGTFFGGTTAMIRADVQGNLKFDPRVPIASDWLFWFEAVEMHHGTIGYVDGVYARYRRHNHNITGQSEHVFKDAMLTLDIIAEKYPSYRKLVKHKQAEYYLIEAYNAAKRKEFGLCLSELGRSITACGGLWYAPFTLVKNTRLEGSKGALTKVRNFYQNLRNRQTAMEKIVSRGMQFGSGTKFIGEQDFGQEPYLINIGKNCIVNDGVRFITRNDAVQVPLIAQGKDVHSVHGKVSVFGAIEIGSNVFIGAGSFILANTQIADNCIVLPGSVVSGNFVEGAVIGGSPAQQISTIEEYGQTHQDELLDLTQVLADEQRKQMILNHVKQNQLENH